jgi:hypothetical protein
MVYAFLADGLNNPKWRPGVQTIALKSGPARPAGRYALTTADDGTTVRFSLDLKLPILIRVLDSLVTKTMESEVAQLQKLKEAIEAA